MRVLLGASVLVDEEARVGIEGAISVASITELHVGVLVADFALR